MKTVTTPSASDWVVVDSTGWVEFLGNGPKCDAFAKYLENPHNVLLPTIVVYEVYKKILREQGQPWRNFFCRMPSRSTNANCPSTSLLLLWPPKRAWMRICPWLTRSFTRPLERMMPSWLLPTPISPDFPALPSFSRVR